MQKTTMLGLIIGPIAITAVVSIARLTCEVQGWIPPTSGGALNPLGISWLAFVFGAWFAIRLRKNGSAPRARPAWLFAVLLLLGVIAAIPWQFAPLLSETADGDSSQRLRSAVLTLVVIVASAGLATFAIWPRLAWTLLCYAFGARATVFLITWVAKSQNWDTHYTKFGPSGIECDLPSTLIATATAQGGFWIPFTIVCGSALGAFFAPKRSDSAASANG
ncbi:MAG: hypothetical protein AB8H80_09190 [Planctomycetota bacterium]